MKKLLNFTLGYSKSRNVAPDNFFTANVPGNVQYDYALANNYPPLLTGLIVAITSGWKTLFGLIKPTLTSRLTKAKRLLFAFWE